MIDTTFDFTTDSYKYWEGFWERKNGLGEGGSDPDSSSCTLQEYHRILWSKELPNGEKMDLRAGSGSNYLTWDNFRFGSDSIITSFRYLSYSYMIEQVKNRVGDYKAFYEDFIHRSYTIGGMIIFPKHRNSMNQVRGTTKAIADRWDLTLECIRRYFEGTDSPLTDVITSDAGFYDLFVDFKGYVDFFFLQDCVSEDYAEVNIWEGDSSFIRNGLPDTIDGYMSYIDNEMRFLQNRNNRIKEFCEVYNI